MAVTAYPGAPSWGTCRVHGTWHNYDGSNKAGGYTVTIPNRVVNSTDDVIIPAGLYKSGTLVTDLGSISLDIQVPANNDPDNIPVDWGKAVIAITFADGSRPETYVLDTPVGGDINLRTVILPSSVPAQAALLIMGQPGGVAQLSADGLNVLDANGDPISFGSAGELDLKADLVGGFVPLAQASEGTIFHVSYTGTAWPPRPTTRDDVSVFYMAQTAADPAPADFVAGVDYLIQPAS